MLIVSDVHANFDALRRVARSGQPLLVLGDLINFIDYRTGQGIAQDVYGPEHTRQLIDNRRTSNWEASRRLWRQATAGREDQVRAQVVAAVRTQHEATTKALAGAEAYVTFGNVDWPDQLRAALPEGARWSDGQVIEIDGHAVGFAGGGVPTPVGARGEVAHDVMEDKLSALGPVDILCTHVAPSVEPLHRDVVTGQLERSSQVVLDYIKRHRPRYHYFGDVHQPQAYRWDIGGTRSVNVGYFRATGRAVIHTP